MENRSPGGENPSTRPRFCYSVRDMAASGPYQIHTEARGPHWVAWITRGADTKPENSVILVAASKEDAEARARKWAEQA